MTNGRDDRGEACTVCGNVLRQASLYQENGSDKQRSLCWALGRMWTKGKYGKTFRGHMALGPMRRSIGNSASQPRVAGEKSAEMGRMKVSLGSRSQYLFIRFFE